MRDGCNPQRIFFHFSQFELSFFGLKHIGTGCLLNVTFLQFELSHFFA